MHALLLDITEGLLETEAVVTGSINTSATVETVCLKMCDYTHQLHSLLAIITVAETWSEQCKHSSSSSIQKMLIQFQGITRQIGNAAMSKMDY